MLQELKDSVVGKSEGNENAGHWIKCSLGDSYKQAKNFDAASLCFFEVKELQDNGVQLGEWCGMDIEEVLQAGRMTCSYELYKKALALENDADRLNDSFEKTEKYERSKSLYSKALKLAPEDEATQAGYWKIQAKLDPNLRLTVVNGQCIVENIKENGGKGSIDITLPT